MASYGSISKDAAVAGAADPSSSEEKTPLVAPTTEKETHVQETAGLWSRLVFGWMIPLLSLGNEKKNLDPEDLDLIPLPQDCETDFISEAFETCWKEELKRSNPSLIRALFRAFGRDFAIGGFCLKAVHDCCIFVGPQVLNSMIFFLRDDQAPISTGLWLTAAVTISQLTMSFCLRHYFFKCYLFGLRIRTAVVVAVYKKALVLSTGERQTRTLGEITNLMSIDAQRLQDLTTYLHAIWYSCLQISLALFFLWKQLGPSCLGGVVVIIIMMPVTKAVATWMGSMQKRLMHAKDQRVEVNSEVLGAMKVIKLQAWEESFQDRILDLRNKELHQLLRYTLANSFSIMLWTGIPLAVALATFATYIISGHQLEVASALTSLALFDILRFPLFMLPQVINRIVEAGISLARVRSFLLCDENQSVGPGGLEDIGIAMENISSAYESKKPRLEGVDIDPMAKKLIDKNWEVSLLRSQLADAQMKIKELTVTDKERKEMKDTTSDEISYLSGSLLCLKRISFECKPGELIAVVGGVGCGKSSFINSILGEVRNLSGTTEVRGRLAFFSQTPFILNATVKANILFSHVNEPVDEQRYQRALECCALGHDLNLLPGGDQTEIGEKGITLSGGQKARVALARAVYHGADISLIDDALSAVDAHVAKHLFQQCIVEELMQGKTLAGESGERGKRSVILATNALQHLSHPRVDKIVVLREGRIAEQGSYAELSKNQKSEFSRFLAVIDETGVVPDVLPELDAKDDSVPGEEESRPRQRRLSQTEGDEKAGTSPEKDLGVDKRKASGLMTTEERATGHVGSDVYFSWARAAGGAWVPFAIVFVYGLVECINVGSKWWLTYWSEHGSEGSQMHFLGIYALINLSAMLASFCRLVLVMLCGLRASRKLFTDMLEVILKAPMSFFDTTPVGRIINRFSKDVYTIDEQLMMALRGYLATLLTVISTIVVISGVTPMFTLCLVPIMIYYMAQQNFFTKTYRELKRLDSVNRSPIYALLGESVDGVATIRAFRAEESLTHRLSAMLNIQQSAYFLTCSAQCWLAVRLEVVGTIIISLTCLSAVWEHRTLGGDERFAGLAGLSISFALSVTQALNWTVRMASDLEASMVAVERVQEYCKIESEAPRVTDSDSSIPVTWPSHGKIEFQSVKLRYRPGLPLVLKGLHIRIPEKAKIGVVGRTGAGKSTLMLSLLRIVELDSGKILIDGVDIRGIGLAKLRSNIAVIPQDPVLFSGDIRTNLDPFNDFSDAELLEVVSRVGLFASATPSTSIASNLSAMSQAQVQSLSDPVREGGSNFSVGQRQLLVIARALLCGASIVIMDEATAAVDADTDARIQKVMITEFANATCITVAHRLNTIMDSDYILVMDDGRAAEFDSPKKLLTKGGMFRDLVQAASKEGSIE